MNNLILEEFPLRSTQSLRYDLLELVTDEDLHVPDAGILRQAECHAR